MKCGKHNLLERILAMVLSLVLVFGMLPVPAIAAEIEDGIQAGEIQEQEEVQEPGALANEGESSNESVEVKEVTLQFENSRVSAQVGKPVTNPLRIEVVPEEAEVTVRYSSRDESIALVDELTGEVTPCSVGMTVITATPSVGEGRAYVLNVSKGDQNIAVNGLRDDQILYMGVPVLLNISGAGDGELSYVIEPEESAEVKDGYLYPLAVGEMTLTVSKAGNDNYNPAADVSVTVQVMPAIIEEPGTVTVLTGSGEFSGEELVIYNASVTVEEDLSGGGDDGWWAYIRVAAPESLADEVLENAVYMSGQGQSSFWADKDSESAIHYIDLRLPLNALREGTVPEEAWRFDWNGDGVADQTVNVTVDPAGITLLDENGERVYPLDVTDFAFVDGSEQTVNFADGMVTLTAQGSGNGTVSYAIAEGAEYASIDPVSGVMTLLDAGTVTVVATKAAALPYLEASAQCTVTIEPGIGSTALYIDGMNADLETVFGNSGNRYSLEADAGMEDALFTYSVSDDSIARIEDADGVWELVILKAGAVDVTVGTEKKGYVFEDSTLTVAVEKADQDFSFVHGERAEVYYGTEEYVIPVSGGNAGYAFEITEGQDIADVDDSGVLYLKDQKQGTVTVKVTKPGDDSYNSCEKLFNLSVVAMPEPEDGYYLDGTAHDGWYRQVDIVAGEGYALSVTNSWDGEWLDRMTVDHTSDGQMIYLRNAEGHITEQIYVAMRVDAEVPVLNVVSDGIAMENWIELVKGWFGFSKDTVKVRFEAYDADAGISGVEYSLDRGENYLPLQISANGEYEIEIDPEYRDIILLKAVDRVGNTTVTDYEGKVFVIDSTAPEFTVVYSANDTKLDASADILYTNAERLMVDITVKEANFDLRAADPVVTVNGTAVEGLVWSENGKASYTLSKDGNYILSIRFSDRAANETVYEKEIHIDNTAADIQQAVFAEPVREINGQKYYNAKLNKPAEAVVTIEEANFDPALVSIAVTRNGVAYTSYDQSPWKTEGSVHTVELGFPEDGIYTMTVSCTDLAGTDGNAYSMDTFVVDTIAPADPVITYKTPSLAQRVLNGITFGFYKMEVEVGIVSGDETSGVDYIAYTYAGINAEDPADRIEVSGRIAGDSGSFKIPADFKGILTAKAYDFAGSVSGAVSESEDGIGGVIVDNTKPELARVTISEAVDILDGGKALYYQSGASVTFQVREANFFADQFHVYDSLNGGEKREVAVEWIADEHTQTYMTAVYEFIAEGKHVVTLEGRDLSANAMDTYTSPVIVIDRTAPVGVSIPGEAADSRNGVLYYQNEGSIEFQVTEINFLADRFQVYDSVNGGEKQAVAVTWTPVAGKENCMSASYTFRGEGEHAVTLEGQDPSGNRMEPVTSALMILDQTKPVVEADPNPDNAAVNILNSGEILYYYSEAAIVFQVTETNFFVDQFQVYDSVNGGEKQAVAVTWAPVEGKENCMSARYAFREEGEHVVTIEGKDLSGNVMDSYVSPTVIIDVTVPEGTSIPGEAVESRNEVLYYQNEGAIAFQVTETNFLADRFQVYDSVNGGEKQPVAVTWVPVAGKVNCMSASYTFREEGEHVVTLEGQDLSGNRMESVTSALMILDQTKPVVEADPNPDNAAVTVLNDGEVLYYHSEAAVAFQVTETNFFADQFQVYDSLNGGEKQPIAVTWAPVEGKENCMSARYTFREEGEHVVTIEGRDLSSNVMDTYTSPVIIVDRTAPVGADIPGEPVESRNEVLYYQNEGIIAFQVTEINFFADQFQVYDSLNGGERQPVAVNWVPVEGKQNCMSASYTFREEGEHIVTLEGRDLSGNGMKTVTSALMILDQTKPAVEADPNPDKTAVNILNDGKVLYYQPNAAIEFLVTETNFFADQFQVYDSLNGGEKQAVTVSWTPLEGKQNTMRAKYVFGDEGEHVVTLEGKDLSGNVMDTYTSPVIVVDKTAPEVDVAFDKDAAVYTVDEVGRQYSQAGRTAVITIKERNFRADEVEIYVTAADAAGTQTPIADYMAEGKNAAKWLPVEGEADTYQLTLDFDVQTNYTFDIQYKDLAHNAAVYGSEKAEDYTVFLFTVDSGKPTGKITASNESFGAKVWEAINELLSKITFGLWTNKGEITVAGEFVDAISPIKTRQYIKVIGPSAAVPLKADALDLRSDWKTGAAVSVNENETFVIYMKVVDMAGNVSYISTNGLIYDEADLEKPACEITTSLPAGGTIFNGDVVLSVGASETVSKPGTEETYSGLKGVYYKIASAEGAVEEGTLWEFAVEDPELKDLVVKPDRIADITVSSEKFNSNHVTVEAWAVDNAGNESEHVSVELAIDITKPQITVDYGNDTPKNEVYFNQDRVATITVYERNFDPAKVVLDIKSQHGNKPKLSDWTTVAGTGNGDNTTHTATLTFHEDDDYEFVNITCTDLATNVTTAADTDLVQFLGAAARKFTVDQTAPVFTITYDNNNGLAYDGDMYYKDPRTATVTIHEHNFRAEDVKSSITAEANDRTVTTRTIGNWVSNGDNRIATVNFKDDADYVMNASYTDLAGNAATPLPTQAFTVDTKAPDVKIEGIKEGNPYRGSVKPVITARDHNFNQEKVTYEMIVRKLTGPEDSKQKIQNTASLVDPVDEGVIITYGELESVRDNDGLYTLTVKVTDRAGNTTTRDVMYAVNRFGSIYISDDATAALLKNGYTKDAPELTIIEINPNKLTSYNMSLAVSGNIFELTEKTDFTVERRETEHNWNEYVYTIKPGSFMEGEAIREGSYTIMMSSVDEAENKNSSSVYAASVEGTENAISFGLTIDRTAPTVVVSGLENRELYEEARPVRIGFQDNNLTKVVIAVNGEETVLEGEELAVLNGEYTLTANESDDWQTIQVKAFDAAGNEFETEEVIFFINNNFWLRLYHNTPMFIGSIVLAAVLLILLILFMRKRNVKKESRVNV